MCDMRGSSLVPRRPPLRGPGAAPRPAWEPPVAPATLPHWGMISRYSPAPIRWRRPRVLVCVASLRGAAPVQARGVPAGVTLGRRGGTEVRDLPTALRRYLLGLDAGCAGLIVYQVWAAYVSGMGTSPLPLAALLFAVLIFVGDHTLLQVRGATWQSFATTAQILALLVLPPPLPLLANLAAVAASQALYVGVLPHKRMFNVAHSCLAVGVAGLGCSLLLRPDRALAGGILAALPALCLLILIYYIVDVGLFLGVLALIERRSIARLWAENYRATLLPEVASATIGVVAAILWRYDPPALALMALPAIALRSAFSAITRAEDRNAELARHKARLEAVLEASEGLRLQAHPADLLGAVARAAHAIAGADSVTGYLRDGEDPARLRRVLLYPAGAVGGPAVFDVSTIATQASGTLPAVVGSVPGEPAPAEVAPARPTRGGGGRRALSAMRSAFPRLGSSPGVPPPPGSCYVLVAPDAEGASALLLLRGIAAPPGPQAVDTLAILAATRTSPCRTWRCTSAPWPRLPRTI